MSDLVQAPKSAYFVRKSPSQASQNTISQPNTHKSSNPLNIPGTRTSIQNSQLLTPIGIPSIDSFIGGGLPVGGICLIGQDSDNHYADIVNRCFIAEGITHKHSIYVANLNEEKDSYFKKIPKANKKEQPDISKTSPNDDQLRIAWRYAQQEQKKSSSDDGFSIKGLQPNYFLMNTFMTNEEINVSNIKTFNTNENEDSRDRCLYNQLFISIEQHIDTLNMNITKTKQYTNILRIVIDGLGGLNWNDKCSINEEDSIYLCRFLLSLRELLRHSLAVCILTVPNELAKNIYLMQKFIHLSDYSFTLDDSQTTISSLTKTQYDGLFRLTKLPRLNSMMQCFMPETLDLAFYVKSKRLIVEQMNLPPELGENDETQKGRTNTSVTMSCSSSSGTGSSKLDF